MRRTRRGNKLWRYIRKNKRNCTLQRQTLRYKGGKSKGRTHKRSSIHKRIYKYKSRKYKTRTHKQIGKYKGGYGPGALPYGPSYTAGNSNSWPGVTGSGNWIAQSPVGIPSGNFQPPISTTNQNGGSILTDITNGFREVGSALSHFGAGVSGYIPQLSSYPSTAVQGIGLADRNPLVVTRMPPNITQLHQNAGTYVARM
jgi:hypothetical protein